MGPFVKKDNWKHLFFWFYEMMFLSDIGGPDTNLCNCIETSPSALSSERVTHNFRLKFVLTTRPIKKRCKVYTAKYIESGSEAVINDI